MTEIKLRISNDELIRRLDEIVKAERYESRNQLICEILSLYVGAKDSFTCKVLPPIVNSICTQEIAKAFESSQITLDNFLRLAKKLSADTALIASFLEILCKDIQSE